uniref:PH domain-containing protein n=1 Tax=Globisporangium ultimum (strain ATCC 200006 / CBS 805.95 / DAOM BR144) TaxID=431595 RepID=K3WAV9_GLOUD
MTLELPELKGYLRKKSRQDRWQRRYFEATTHYLTYYKSRESEKLLACIDLWRTQNIELNADDPSKLEFSIGIGEQSYLLKAETADEAQRWIKGLRARQHRPEGAPSEVFSRRSEQFDAESDASSEYSSRRPGYASSDTGSHGNDRKQKQKQQQQYHTNYTDSSANPIVPNANAIAAGKYPMLKTDQSVPKKSGPADDNIDAACCAPCKTM